VAPSVVSADPVRHQPVLDGTFAAPRVAMRPDLAWSSLVTALVVGCIQQPATDPAGDSGGKGDVWGDDDRKERFEIESAPLRAAAHSSAATFRLTKLQHDAADTWSVASVSTLGEREDLCDDQRFVSQPAAASCSATLIADDIMVSAGHCFDSRPCTEIAIVFDFAYATRPTDPMAIVNDIPAANVYTCAEMLATRYEVDYDTSRGVDYAVFRLDRNVTGRVPVQVNWGDPLAKGKPAYVIGHPTGLPQKLAAGVILDATANPDFISHDADVFSGNSGGGLFDANGALIGIHDHSAGKRYVPDDARGCNVVAVCDDNVDCVRTPHAYDTRALKSELSAELQTRLGIPASPM
jgi:hypothetical protein